MRLNAQCKEDQWIIENLKPPIGVYCEVGAFNGVQSSNTIAFEDLGWAGILVEADPWLASHCQEKRNAQTFCCAAGKEAIASFHINKVDRGLSGLTRPGVIMPVVVVPLSKIIRAAGYQHINLLSIDTEGTELDVWNTRGKCNPDIVVMEHQTSDEPSNRDPILRRMVLDGYQLVHETQYNFIFIPK